jgi:transposase
MTTNALFETALGITKPYFVKGVDFERRQLTIRIDFAPGSRFAHPQAEGLHPVHDTQTKRLRHLNFFQHECHLEVRVPRVRLPDGKVALIEPDWFGKLSGFTLLFEALVLMLAQQMPFAAVARIIGESWHRVHAICTRYVDRAVEDTDLSAVKAVAIDETSYQRGHKYLTIAVDADKRAVIFVTKGRDAETVAAFADHLRAHTGDAANITAASIDMSPAYIKGVTENLPNAKITFDKFHVIAAAGTALDEMRRSEQKTDPDLKGYRWALLKDRRKLTSDVAAGLVKLVMKFPTKRTARAYIYREQLRHILNRKQINVVTAMLKHWCTCVMRSKVEPMKDVAAMIRRHFEGIVAWTQTRQTNGLIEAINGLFQAAKRRARGYTRFETMKTVLFLIAGKLDFTALNPHAAHPLGIQ